MKTSWLILAVLLGLLALGGPVGSVPPVSGGGSIPAETVPSAPPADPDGWEEIPVWKFCHAASPDGLDTAVIRCFTTDCEEGPVPAEVSEDELESIRSLALYGVVTGRRNDTMVTGGTWLYTFEAPDGTWLLSVELYQGLLVGPDGMYGFSSGASSAP